MLDELAQEALDLCRQLVSISSPSGDVAGAEEMVLALSAAAPQAQAQRLTSSSADYPADLLLRWPGRGRGRLLLLGHADTVIAHADHQPLWGSGSLLRGSGCYDMKGGLALALACAQALTRRPKDYDEIALLVVCDEETRSVPLAHAALFDGWDACLCFEGGERAADGRELVVHARKGAFSLRVEALGQAAHSGANPYGGANAIDALALLVRQLGRLQDPQHGLSAVPVQLYSGTLINQVPAHGELICDLRAYRRSDAETLLRLLPAQLGQVVLESDLQQRFPPWAAEATSAALIESASARLGRELIAVGRGGSADINYFADRVGVCIDGLGPIGGDDHSPSEWIDADSMLGRLEIAYACAVEALA